MVGLTAGGTAYAQCSVDGNASASCDGDGGNNNIVVDGAVTDVVQPGGGDDTVTVTESGSVVATANDAIEDGDNLTVNNSGTLSSVEEDGVDALEDRKSVV